MPKLPQILKSKTLWTAAATIAAGAWQAATPFIPPQYAPLVLTLVPAAAHAIVRCFTNSSLSEK